LDATEEQENIEAHQQPNHRIDALKHITIIIIIIVFGAVAKEKIGLHGA